MPFLAMVLSRRKSKQALRDFKKVQIQLENLESSVRDRCKKEFTGEAARTHPWARIQFDWFHPWHHMVPRALCRVEPPGTAGYDPFSPPKQGSA